MKVIFLQDLPRVAQAGDTRDVADGFARNFLIPQGLAIIAKPGAVNIVATRQIKTTAELADLAQKLEGVEVNLKARAGAKDRLYGAVTTADIASELSETTGLVIDKRKIELDQPIRQIGSYDVTIKLAKDITPKIKVTVAEEETT
ncbi:50S ribosomal protein L9 [Chloroflexota bacterium]